MTAPATARNAAAPVRPGAHSEGRQNHPHPTPPTPTLYVENIPAILRALPRWVLWRYSDQPRTNGTYSKVPHTAQGSYARTNDPTTWTTFGNAVATYQRGGFDGIGIIMDAPAPGEPAIVAIDIDGCIGPGGTLTSTAAAIVALVNSYTEVSPSGHGLRIFTKGTVPDGSRKRVRAIECYSDGQFVTVTGNHVPDTPETVNERTAALATFAATHLATPTSGGDRHDQHGGGGRAGSPADAGGIDDDQLLSLARRANGTGVAFTRLFDAGDLDMHDGDHSRADYRLCRMLLYWTGGDIDRADRLFRRSALFRDKWDAPRDGSTYGAITLRKAAPTVVKYYQPEGRTGATDGEPPDDGDDRVIRRRRPGRTEDTAGSRNSDAGAGTGHTADGSPPACVCGCCDHQPAGTATVRRLMAQITQLTHERDQAIRERNAIHELHRAMLAVLGNDALNPQARIVAIRATNISHGSNRDADGFVPVFIGSPDKQGSLCNLSGAGRKRAGTYLEQLVDAGVFERRVEKVIPDQPNAPVYNRVRLRPCDPSPIATLQRIAAVRPEPVGAGHGGRRVRRCPEGCDAPIIVRTDHICSACGTLIDRQERSNASATGHDDPLAGASTTATRSATPSPPMADAGDIDGEASIAAPTGHDDPPHTDASAPPSRVDLHQWGQDDPLEHLTNCPGCGGVLVGSGCWPCGDGFCTGCGARTGSPMRFCCGSCQVADEARRWAVKAGGGAAAAGG